MTIRYGLCCIHLGLQDQGYKFQTMTYKGYTGVKHSNPEQVRIERATNNLVVLKQILNACADKNWCYRVGCGIIPLMTHPLVPAMQDPNVDRLIEECKTIVLNRKIRISMHPDQFNVLGSGKPEVVKSTIRELTMQSEFMTRLGAKESHENPINIHMNSSKDGIQLIEQRFVDNFYTLPDHLKSRLVIENEDIGCWNVEELYNRIYRRTRIPVTFDYLHHRLNSGNLSEQIAFEMAYGTWGNVIPLFHYSESIPGDKNPKLHAEYASGYPRLYGKDNLDIDWELKGKDKSLLRSFG